MGRSLRRIVLVAVGLALAGCGREPPPPTPNQSLVPDTVALAHRWDFAPCAGYEVRLASGDLLDVVPRDVSSPGCEAREPTLFLAGEASVLTHMTAAGIPWSPSERPLVYAGTVDGSRWLAVVRPDGHGRWCHRFDKGDGAYLFQGGIHLASGLVVPLADNFRFSDDPVDEFPLRNGDQLCMNEDGEALFAHFWHPI